jgi:DNA polymerase-1
MSFDYSQIELRILANFSNDENMIKAFDKNTDFHTKTASFMFNVNENEVTTEMRKSAKAINFGIIYGMGEWSLSESLKVSYKEASEFITNYFLAFPNVKKFQDQIVKDASSNGYVTTSFGRRRYLDGISSSNRTVYESAKRYALNAPIQGTAADIIKFAMVNISKKMKNENLKSLMIAQIHDELLFDVVNEEKDKIKELVLLEMEEVVSLQVKLIVSVGIGKSWEETK